LYSGKIGYVARGIVWLVIAFLMLKAAWHANATQAGGSVEAFQFIEQSRYGSYLLGIVGLGLIAYGFFNFVRARYENFDKT
jgi:plastocyanin domain-containing protein